MGLLSGSEGLYIPKRYIVTFLGFFAAFNSYTLMVNLTVAMVAMVNGTAESTANESYEKSECFSPTDLEESSAATEFKGHQFRWSPSEQGLILGAYFYGYVVTQVPGGLLCKMIGAKWVLGGGILSASLLTLLVPLAARGGFAAIMTVRVMIGLFEGATMPALNHIIGRWSPVMERSRMSSVIYAGLHVGSVVSLTASGWLSSIDFLGGWPSVFYVFGILGCLWFVLWVALMHETPSTHPSISKAELDCIMKSRENLTEHKLAMPWKDLLTSIPMWAAVVAHVGDTLGLLVFLIEIPNYLSSVFYFNLQANGFLSALPIIMQGASACLVSLVADKMRSLGIFSINTIRKIFNTIGFLGPAICLLIVTAIGCRSHFVVALFTLGMTLNGFVFSGIYSVYVDMCPEFAGTVFGLANAFCNLFGIIAPAIVAAFTSSGSTIANWNKVFYTTSATYIACAIIFLVFGSAEEQPWAKTAQEKHQAATKATTSGKS